jgi:hypothetical protein
VIGVADAGATQLDTKAVDSLAWGTWLGRMSRFRTSGWGGRCLHIARSRTLTCVGYIHDSNSRDIDKVLSASAFFNEDVLAVEINANKVTTLEVSPVVKKQAHSSFLVKVKVFMPDLNVKIIESDSVVDEAIINHRTEQSVAWDDYSGPLKFNN